ncbi:hypothetical protein ACRRTK_023503 [Alexandromys fortis]
MPRAFGDSLPTPTPTPRGALTRGPKRTGGAGYKPRPLAQAQGDTPRPPFPSQRINRSSTKKESVNAKSLRLPLSMCAAEVDRHVAQRYLIKRRLGKGRTFREVTLLQEFGDHPNIIRLLDVIPAENDKDIYLVFESMDTDLNAVIQKGRLLEDIHKRCIFYQLLRATKFIHSGRVIHRDQKPANVLLDAACRVKLCDFGLARSLSDLPEGPEGQALTEYVATRWYRAPEVLLSCRWYTPGVDMWSLGCILGEMLRGQPLFPGTSTFHQLELILETIPLPSMEELQGLGSDYSALILKNLGSKALERRRQAAARRPRQTLDALLPPDTPPEALDLLKRLLAFAPDKRLSAEQALQHPYVQRFHCPDREWTRGSDVRLPVHEGDQLSAPEYRNRLYQVLGLRTRVVRFHGYPRSLLLQRPQCRPAPSERPSHPADDPGAEGEQPQPSRRRPVGTTNVRSGNLTPGVALMTPQKSPGRAQTPCSNFRRQAGGKGHQGPQRSHPRHPQGAVRTPQSPAPLFSLLNKTLACVQVPPRLSREAPEPRPGRRMFGTSASQGAQGAARAALGGYSQAYGTVCRSALGRLPLLPGPRA